MPYPHSPQDAAKDKSRRKNYDQIPTQRNDKRSSPPSKSLQRTTCRNRHRRNQKSRTYNTKSRFSGSNCLRIRSKHSHKLPRNSQTDDGSNKHDHTTHTKCNIVDFFDTFMLSGTVIIPDHRTHSLYDPARRKIEKCLQFIVDSKDHNITLRVGSKKSVQCRNKHRWKRKIQCSRNANRV